MKKTTAILFLTVFLFNWFGYRLLSSFLQEKAGLALIISLDNDQYDESDLLSIKLPSNLPYYTNSKHFTRMDGEIEIDGIHYNYVKCRMYQDSLEYLCIPNKARNRLSSARDEFYKLVNDLRHPSPNKKNDHSGSFVKSPLSEFCEQGTSWSFNSFFSSKLIVVSAYNLIFPKPDISPRELPPDFC